MVNLHRAKVEEIEVEPPSAKRRCTRARRPSSSEETDSPRSSPSSSGSSSSRHLNTNTCSSTEELMDTSEHLAVAPSSVRRRASSRYMDHSSLRTGHDRHPNPSPNTTITTPSPIVVGESSTAASSSACRSTGLGGVHPHSLGDARPPCVADTSSHLTRSTSNSQGGAFGGSSAGGATHSSSSTSSPMTISNLLKSSTSSSSMSSSSPSLPAPVTSYFSPISSPPSPMSSNSLMPPPPHPNHHKKPYYHHHHHHHHRHSSRKVPEGYKQSPTGSGHGQGGSGRPPPSPNGQGTANGRGTTSAHKSPDSNKPCCSNSQSSSKARTVSRSVQTDPEAGGSTSSSSSSSSSRSRDERESSSGRRVGSKREMRLPDSGVNMKRKAVMEAISEILKKMYANSDKGRLPGSFKGRFSSEFTCDSDMSEILHSKTTMTSYNSEVEEAEKPSEGPTHSSVADPALVSKAKYEENEQLRDKVAQLKWKMQHRRAIKMAKRKGERSPCGWMEALNCSMPGSPPTARERTGYAGMKRGFLLSD